MEKCRCFLCKKEERLQQSHVISESFYKDLYDDKGRYSIVVASEFAKDPYKQKGIREPLLCYECEQLLANRYEDHGADVFRKIKFKATELLSEFTFSPVRYEEFKLFQICQLWRMAISTNPMWQNVDLSDTIEDRLREMLLTGDPGGFDYFGVMMEAVIAGDRTTFDAFTPAITIRIGGYDFVVVTFGGFSWYFCVSESVADGRLNRFFTTADGSVTVGSRALRDAWYIQRFGDELEAAGKL